MNVPIGPSTIANFVVMLLEIVVAVLTILSDQPWAPPWVPGVLLIAASVQASVLSFTRGRQAEALTSQGG